ncbi:hypothetical protein NP493_11g14008 [Ridgeia piscesae]|uniref:G-protein coupled receptors family 3 profile domain-containing protein n=1 Tax=Ridgeia piscesae TaxID=27915 RepID=A0AAD9PFL8_RIDPI|nr:hypothetical protein NP493_11g14008 [Ridgeia piscesae]
MNYASTLLWVAWLTSLLPNIRAIYSVPGLPPSAYHMDGDLLLGGIFRVHQYSANDPCGERVRSPKSFQYHEAMVHAIRQVNELTGVLPNVTLGFVILDDCTKDQVALVRSLQYVSPAANMCRSDVDDKFPPYDVVGVISGSNSQNTMTSAGLLNMFHVPMVAAVATSEQLSDKTKYAYFARVVPSDTFQAQAIVDLLLHYNWTYVSLINSEGGYGETGAKFVYRLAAERGICVALSHTIYRARGTAEFDDVARLLAANDKARAVVMFVQVNVVMFVQGEDGRGVVSAVRRLGPEVGRFIWIMSDGVSPLSDLMELEDVATGSFFIQLYATGSPGFFPYFEALTVATSTNPWLRELYEDEFNCSWSDPARWRHKCNASATVGDMPNYGPYNKTSLFLDSVVTFATALDRLVAARCPRASGEALRACVRGETLMEYVRNATDETNDHHYDILQLQRLSGGYHEVLVGTWERAVESVFIDEAAVRWAWEAGAPETLPESVCSHACRPGEFRIQLEQKCCWECRHCRNNEIVTVNGTSCVECDVLYWPDTDNASVCLPITPTSYTWRHTVSMLGVSVSVVGAALCVVVFVFYVYHRDRRLIKATNRELSVVGLKTNCIYRVFVSAKRSVKPPKYTRWKAQLVIASLIIGVEVVIIVVTTAIAPPKVQLRMPVRTEQFVELLCHVSHASFLPPLVYNMLLIVMCSVYAVKTRRLPDNFNESKLIFLLVLATLFLWLAFLPTYFTAYYAQQKVALLTMFLVLNSTLMILCLYAPKVYAILYVNETLLNIGQGVMLTTTSSTNDAPRGGQRLQSRASVAPLAPVAGASAAEMQQ